MVVYEVVYEVIEVKEVSNKVRIIRLQWQRFFRKQFPLIFRMMIINGKVPWKELAENLDFATL